MAQGDVDPREEAKRQKELLLSTAGILPTELVVMQGEELFHRKGPSGKTMAECDFGLGKGVLEGAAARTRRIAIASPGCCASRPPRATTTRSRWRWPTTSAA